MRSMAALTVGGLLGLSISGCGWLKWRPETALTSAIARERVEEVRTLLKQGADPNQKSRGLTPLAVAARMGDLESIDLLLDRGADVNLKSGVNDWTPMMHAIHKGQTEAVVKLLARGADCNAKTPSGLTALIMAAGDGNLEVVRTLLRTGADPYASTRDGVTALTMAVSGGAFSDIDRPLVGRCQTPIVRALLERAPDLAVGKSFSATYARLFARVKGCSDVLDLVDRRKSAKPAR